MVQGSYTQLASEVKMKGQRRFPPGKACSLPPNQWYSRHLENGKKIEIFWRLKFVRSVDFFLGVGEKRGVTNLCISQFHLRPCPYSSRVAPGVGKYAAKNDRRPCSLAPRGLFTVTQPQADYEQRDFGIRRVLFSKKGKENRLKCNKKTWRTRSHVLLNRTWIWWTLQTSDRTIHDSGNRLC